MLDINIIGNTVLVSYNSEKVCVMSKGSNHGMKVVTIQLQLSRMGVDLSREFIDYELNQALLAKMS